MRTWDTYFPMVRGRRDMRYCMNSASLNFVKRGQTS